MILVTGGTGLVGSHLLYELVKKDEPIRAIIRNKNKIEIVKKIFSYYTSDPESYIQKIEWVIGDVLDIVSLDEAFLNVDTVYHCAAIVSFNDNNKIELILANVQGTENIVNLCLSYPIKKLCHVSSIASLGSSLNGELVDETTQWSGSKNHSVYSVSKFKSEMEVWRGVQEGLNAIIVNPSVILGPGFWNNGSGSLFTKAAKGMKYFTTGSTGFVDVRDVVQSMVQLMDRDSGAERYILNSENISYKELFDWIAEEMQVSKPKHEATNRLLKLAVIMDWVASGLKIKKREITKEIVRSSQSVSKYSHEKIKKELGISFIPIKLSLHEIAKQYKKEITIN